MDILKRFKLGVPKRVLFFAAALVWGIASYRIISMGIVDAVIKSKYYLLNIPIGLIIFYLFSKNVFNKMYLKHTKRIINGKIERPCIFSFFDFKGYVIMAFMITGGIALRRSKLIPPVYLGIFFIGLGLSLLLASAFFLYSGVRYAEIKEKYYIEKVEAAI